MTKIVTLDNLAEFKAKCDETYSGGGGGTTVYQHNLFISRTYSGQTQVQTVSAYATVYKTDNEPINDVDKLTNYIIAKGTLIVSGTYKSDTATASSGDLGICLRIYKNILDKAELSCLDIANITSSAKTITGSQWAVYDTIAEL